MMSIIQNGLFFVILKAELLYKRNTDNLSSGSIQTEEVWGVIAFQSDNDCVAAYFDLALPSSATVP